MSACAYASFITALDCGNPGNPPNGIKTGSNYFFPNLVSYSCNVGFRLVGPAVRRCQNNGLWSGSPATCQRKNALRIHLYLFLYLRIHIGSVGVSCGDPGEPLHGTRKIIAGVGRNYVFEDTVKLKCGSFYSQASGNQYRTCLQDGRWNGSQLTCSPSELKTKMLRFATHFNIFWFIS